MKSKNSSCMAFVWALALLLACLSCSERTEQAETLMTFNGSSADLAATKVVPTLDTPNKRLTRQPIVVVRQDILFRMNKSGVELKSEAKIQTAGTSTDYNLDSPFLVCVKSRKTGVPYFAMWVDNAELMRPWQSTQR